MPDYLIAAASGSGAWQGDNTTVYMAPVGNLPGDFGTEAWAQMVARDSYTLSKLYVRVKSNSINTTVAVRSRKNGAYGNQIISVPSSTTGVFTDTVNTDSLVDGDLFCTESYAPNVTGDQTIVFTIFSYILSTLANTTPILGACGKATLYAGYTQYLTIVGYALSIIAAPEWKAYYKFRVAATLSNLRVYVSANAITNDSTIRTRIDAANGNQTLTILASTTGAFEDATNTDNIAVGQNVNCQFVGGEDITSLTLTYIEMKSNSDGRQVAAAASHIIPFNPGLTRYVAIEGHPDYLSVGEAGVQATARSSFTAKNAYFNILQNSLDGTSIYKLRKNGGDSTLSVSIPAGTTGQLEDLVHTEDYIATDLVNWLVQSGGSSGEITLGCSGFELAQPAAPPVVGSKSANMGSKMVAAELI
ncbi:hypothetical protein ES703_16054 [subsurface metagenome]